MFSEFSCSLIKHILISVFFCSTKPIWFVVDAIYSRSMILSGKVLCLKCWNKIQRIFRLFPGTQDILINGDLLANLVTIIGELSYGTGKVEITESSPSGRN